MCGIVAYIGNKNAQPILIEGLKRLEYRGYDSAGIALLSDGAFRINKSAGRISQLEELFAGQKPASIGIGHTRWATHGKPNTINAHPHMDRSGKITIVITASTSVSIPRTRNDCAGDNPRTELRTKSRPADISTPTQLRNPEAAMTSPRIFLGLRSCMNA